MSHGRWTRVPILLLSLLSLTTALAEEAGQMAERYYMSGEYRQAIDAFKSAYMKEPHPTFLFNIAQSQRLMGNRQEAITMYERFLHEAPGAPQRGKAEGYIKEMRAQIAAERAREEVERRAREEAERHARKEAERMGAIPEPPPGPAVVPVYRRWWFWTVVGGVVAAGAVTTGVVFGTRTGYAEPPAGLPVLMAPWQ